jgi:hypothetical protein
MVFGGFPTSGNQAHELIAADSNAIHWPRRGCHSSTETSFGLFGKKKQEETPATQKQSVSPRTPNFRQAGARLWILLEWAFTYRNQ